MNQEQINREIFKRLEKLEKQCFAKVTRFIKGIEKSKTSEKNSLPVLILKLRDSGFFNHPQSVSEVHKKLQPIYPCDFNRVEVALLRLHKKRQLRKTLKIIGDKKVIAYVW